MRSGPTFGYLGWVGGAVVALALSVGCAAGEPGLEDPTEEPSADDEAKEAPKKKENPEDESPPPKFEPAFDESKPAEGDDKSKDPAPPNADQCIDNGDPGGSENVATKPPDTDDCDNDYKTLTGVANGAVDVDFYRLSGNDKGISFSHPLGCSLDTDFQGETAGTEVCVFMRCKNSTVDAVKGCDKGTAATSEIGMKGCCAAAPAHALPKWDCKGLTDDDSADIFIKVRQVNGDKCLPYKVKYRF